MEFARMRLRGHWYGGRALQNAFDHPSVRRRLERQRLHDRASLHLPPIDGASAPLPLPPYQSSYIVQRWHGLKREVDALRADQEIYTQIRALNPSPVFQWKQYERRWDQALVAEDSPLLAFTDIPWPTGLLKPHDGSHITAVDVHRFVLSTTELDSVPDYALQRIDGEIARWRTDRFATHVLPRVAPWCRESVAAAAGAVLDILLAARRDILIYHGLRRNTA
jgi:hypothetical protein